MKYKPFNTKYKKTELEFLSMSQRCARSILDHRGSVNDCELTKASVKLKEAFHGLSLHSCFWLWLTGLYCI